MRVFSLFVIICFSAACCPAQNMGDARRKIYYQRYETAKQILRNMISSQQAVTGETWYLLGEVYLKQKRIDSAFMVIQQAENFAKEKKLSKSETQLILIGKAHVLLDSGNAAAARVLLEELLDETKYKNVPLLVAAANANTESKNGDAKWAVELLEKAQSRSKKNAAVYLAMGNAYRKIAAGGNAVLNYAKAVELDPSLAEAKYKEGLIYKTQNNEAVYLERFSDAVGLDSAYAPALYQLYAYYFTTDVVKADYFLKAFLRHSDWSVEHLYMEADLDYVSGKFASAVRNARNIVSIEGEAAQARIFKLMAYSYAADGDTAAALQQMKTYFKKQDSADFVAKDFVLMAKLTRVADAEGKAAVAEWYQRAIEKETAAAERLEYMTVLADIEKEQNNSEAEARWRGEIVKIKPAPTNLDIYKWGTALYASENYTLADSVFQLYEEKYPSQVYGYLWRAKCNALIDTSMSLGLAVPHYRKLIEVAGTDSLKNKTILLNAYGYLGTYEANIKKDYQTSLEYFNKMLALDPDNEDALKFTATLKKWLNSADASN